jgi:HPt (histidine-containing phosphotransfer) domain-containing protein
MSSAPGPSIEAALAAVRAQFASALPEKAANVGTLLARGAWDEARRAAHRLRGSAGTYGFAPLGAVAAAIEDLLLAEPAGPREQTRERLERLAGDLLAQAELAAAERP